MANYNGAEKRFPNAIEGMLASQGIGATAQKQRVVARDFFDMDDEEIFDAIGFSDQNDGDADMFVTVRTRPHVSKVPIHFWHDLKVIQHPLDNSNDNIFSPARVIDASRSWVSSHTYLGLGQSIVRELSRLTAGWAGEGSVAPSNAVLRDMLTVTALLPVDTAEPETEVDPDDGSVVLRWLNADATSSFSLTFLGKGEVGGFLSSPVGLPAWKIRISDASQITGKLTNEGVLNLISA